VGAHQTFCNNYDQRTWFVVSQDGSVFDQDRKLIYQSSERFRRDVGEGQVCFICSANPHDKSFNDEHVIPDWVLRECGLHDKTIVLANQKGYPYGRYKIPCCEECNSELGKRVEVPISELFKGGYEHFTDSIVKDTPWQVFHWICLIFLKTHLKDRHLPFHLDRRQGEGPIATAYDWSLLHHISCIARSHYTKASIHNFVMGSLWILPAKSGPGFGEFDFADLYGAQTVLIRVHDIAIIAVLNDACGCHSLQPEFIQKIEGRLAPIQLRELMVRIAHLNMLIKERPVFHSTFNDGEYKIGVDTPKAVELEEGTGEQLGKLMFRACDEFIDSAVIPGNAMTHEQMRNHIRAGELTFLVDSDGKFIDHQLASDQEAEQAAP
jgi:hypothetical protein